MEEQNEAQLETLYGPQPKYSEHKQGETIKFYDNDEEKQGTILWVRAPGPARIGGEPLPLAYIVDADEGFPSVVYPGEVIQ